MSSFAAAGVLGMVALLAVGLAMLAIWLFGFPLGFMAIIGTFGLIGVAINDSIVVLAEIRANPRANAGDVTAIVDAVLQTGRHLLATTLTTIGGFLPLILADGLMWPPMAVAIGGGVAGATLVAFFFVPSAHAWLARRQARTVAMS